jgi:hypothetical protein
MKITPRLTVLCSAFIVSFICGPIHASAGQLDQRNSQFEVSLEGGESGAVATGLDEGPDGAAMLAFGVTQIAGIVDKNGKDRRISWILYWPRGAKDLTWYINAHLPESILNHFNNTVDDDGGIDKQPWKAYFHETNPNVTVVHTSYNWLNQSKNCQDEVGPEPPKKICDAARILEVPIRTFHTFGFVKRWEVKEYLPHSAPQR